MQNKEYITLDLGEAAALATIGYDLVRLEKTRKENQRAFVFESVPPEDVSKEYPKADLAVDDYRRRRLDVDAYSFYITLKELKSRLHDSLAISQ